MDLVAGIIMVAVLFRSKMNYCMSFQSNVISYPSLFGDDMKNCFVCNNEFYARHRATACSLKCKILDGISKQENGCWLYKNTSSGIYSKIRWQMKWYSAHRVSYQEFVGPIPVDKLVCHKCDTPKCVNPEHLFIGTHKDNRKDCILKKRTSRGENNHFTVYTDNQIKEMRLLKQEGFTYERISRIFNCSFSYLYHILKNNYRKE